MLLLVLDCLGIVMMFTGAWYFQSSLVELRTMINQHEQIMEQKKEITGQRNEMLVQIIKTTKQADTIQQLKEKLDDLLLKLQIEKSLFQVAS